MPSMTATFEKAFAPAPTALSDDRIDRLARMIDRLERRLFLAPLPFDDESERHCATLRRRIDQLEDELDQALQAVAVGR